VIKNQTRNTTDHDAVGVEDLNPLNIADMQFQNGLRVSILWLSECARIPTSKETGLW
jgi:hypothetical protein